jgi:SAM-dependent methyltransferase
VTGGRVVDSLPRPRSRPAFRRRSDTQEWLDRTDLDPRELAAVLRDLTRFNAALLGHYPILRWLARAVRGRASARPLAILDAGCGYGDLLRAIRRWADRRGLPVSLVGIDLNPETIRLARAAAEPNEQIDFVVGDALRFAPPGPVDLIVNSLLAHHLPDSGIDALLRWMEATARRGWLIADLQRNPVPYHLIAAAGALLRVHPVVVADGQISVTRSLTRSEWVRRLAAAGIPSDATTVRWFLYRWLIGRLR